MKTFKRPPELHSVLIFGAGYVGSHLATALNKAGVPVYMSTRTADKYDAICKTGAVPFLFGERPPSVSHVVITNPPLSDGTDPVLATYGSDWPDSVKWVGYLSSTGVYGDYDGKKVTEKSALNAAAPRSVARKKAEGTWQATQLPLEVFRLSGIYGPNRNMLERLKEGRISGLERSDKPVNRIHVADIVQVVLASIMAPNPKAVYNLADDVPAPTAEVIAYAAQLLGTVPPTGDGHSSHLMDGSRIIDNNKIKKELGIKLLYPSYKEGLKDCL